MINFIKTEEDRDTANFVLQLFVAVAVVGTIYYCLWTLTTVELKSNNNNAFLMILGGALAWMGALISFAFPNSIGSAKKDDTLNKAIGKITDVNPSGNNLPDQSLALRTGGPTTISVSAGGGETGLGLEGEFGIPRPNPVDGGGDQHQSELADGGDGLRDRRDVLREREEPRKFGDRTYPVHGSNRPWPWDNNASVSRDDS